MENRTQKVTLAILVAILVILGAVLVSLVMDLSLVEKLVMSWILTVFYSLFAFYLLDTYKIKEVIREVRVPVQVQKPYIVNRDVIREVPIQVPIQIPMENKTIEVIETPGKTIYVDRPVNKIVYREKKRKHLDIPKYKYIASTQTRTYHKNSCRLGKLIKRKYKLHSNSQAFFKKKRFKACKMCLKRK